jgi:hypothetical protein
MRNLLHRLRAVVRAAHADVVITANGRLIRGSGKVEVDSHLLHRESVSPQGIAQMLSGLTDYLRDKADQHGQRP